MTARPILFSAPMQRVNSGEDFSVLDVMDSSDFDDIDCGLGLDGQCCFAGSEYCDWECGRLA